MIKILRYCSIILVLLSMLATRGYSFENYRTFNLTRVNSTYVIKDHQNYTTVPSSTPAIISPLNESDPIAIIKRFENEYQKLSPLKNIVIEPSKEHTVWFPIRVISPEASAQNPISLTVTLNHFNHGRVEVYDVINEIPLSIEHKVIFNQIGKNILLHAHGKKLPTYHYTAFDNLPRTLLFKISEPVSLTFDPVATVWKHREFLQHNQTSATLDSLFIGLIFSAAIMGLLFIATLREIAYLWFGLFCFSITVICYYVTGNGLAMIWVDYPWLNKTIAKLSVVLSIVFAILFSENYLRLGNIILNSSSLLKASIVIGFVMAAGITFNTIPDVIVAFYVISCALSLTALSFLCWRAGSQPAVYFFSAWLAMILSLIFFSFTNFGGNYSIAISKASTLSGFSIAVLLFMTGLMEGFSLERRRQFALLSKRHETALRLKEAESRLVHRALHSKVTGLPNRTLLLSRLENCLNDRYVKTNGLSLILIGINNFQEINKTLGHENGDVILQMLADQLSRLIRMFPSSCPIEYTIESEACHLSAVDGVVFAAIFKTADKNILHNYIKEIIQIFNTAFDFHGMHLDIQASVGVSIAEESEGSANTLLRKSQIALQNSQKTSDPVSFYEKRIDPYSANKLTLISDLRNALENNKLILYYQPQILIETGEIVGAEALIRWNHPSRGFISPDEFIPIAEKTGIIHSLTTWILNTSLEFYKKLLEKNIDIAISINISARNLHHQHFSEELSNICQSQHISTSKILLELTETAVMIDASESCKMINKLKSAGFHMAIDDFGTGYSSLSYLKRIPVSQMKIDRSFIMGIGENANNKSLVHAIVHMAHSLNLEIVAEGIEDGCALDFLKSIKCTIGQGYYIAKPMDDEAFIQWALEYKKNNAA